MSLNYHLLACFYSHGHKTNYSVFSKGCFPVFARQQFFYFSGDYVEVCRLYTQFPLAAGLLLFWRHSIRIYVQFKYSMITAAASELFLTVRILACVWEWIIRFLFPDGVWNEKMWYSILLACVMTTAQIYHNNSPSHFSKVWQKKYLWKIWCDGDARRIYQERPAERKGMDTASEGGGGQSRGRMKQQSTHQLMEITEGAHGLRAHTAGWGTGNRRT